MSRRSGHPRAPSERRDPGYFESQDIDTRPPTVTARTCQHHRWPRDRCGHRVGPAADHRADRELGAGTRSAADHNNHDGKASDAGLISLKLADQGATVGNTAGGLHWNRQPPGCRPGRPPSLPIGAAPRCFVAQPATRRPRSGASAPADPSATASPRAALPVRRFGRVVTLRQLDRNGPEAADGSLERLRRVAPARP